MVPKSVHPGRQVALRGFLSFGQEPLQCSAILRGRSFTSTEALINEYKKHFAAGHSNFHRELFCIVDDVGDVLHCFTDFLSEILDVFRHN
jgi:hypothetical protein